MCCVYSCLRDLWWYYCPSRDQVKLSTMVNLVKSPLLVVVVEGGSEVHEKILAFLFLGLLQYSQTSRMIFLPCFVHMTHDHLKKVVRNDNATFYG